MFLIMGMCAWGSAGSLTEVSAQPYPVGDLRILREDLTSQTFRLKIDNLDLTAGAVQRTRNQTYFVAGVKGRAPTFNIESATFKQLKDGRETTTTMEAPKQIRQNLIKLNDLGLFRQYWIYTLTITTVSPDGSDMFWVLDNADIVIDIGAPVGPLDEILTNRWDPDFGGERFTGGMLINPGIHSDYYYANYNDPVPAWKAWTDRMSQLGEDGNLFRFSVYHGGFYRLAQQDLDSVTSAPVGVSPSKWRVFLDGKEVPLVRDPVHGDEAVYLPVPARPEDGLRETVYWLDTSGIEMGAMPPKRLSVDVKTTETTLTNTQFTTSGLFEVTHRKLKNYNPKLKPGPGGDRWVWAEVDAGSATRLELDFPAYFAPPEGSTVQTSVRYGFSNMPAQTPRLVLYIGNQEALRTTLSAQMGTAVFDVAASMFKPGRNEIAFRLDYPMMIGLKRPITIQDINTKWSQPLVIPAEGSYTFVQDLEGTASAGLKFAAPIPQENILLGFTGQTPTILDSKNGMVSFKGDHFSGFELADTESPDIIKNVEIVRTMAQLDDISSAQSVIVTTSDLVDDARPLAEMHEKRGLSHVIYSTRDLYDVFSYGQHGPDAIKNALKYMYYMADGDVPEYVTLIGEASDFKGDPDIAPPVVQLDMVPASTAGSADDPQGDHEYAAVLGSDLVDDLMVGRIPVANAEQLADYIAKSTAYESAPAGDWSRNASFVMDDNDEFPDVVQRIVESAMAPPAHQNLFRQWDYEYVPNLRVPGKKRSWGATEALVASFNEGVGVLNFFGHGGPNLWSHERLFHLSDLELISNLPRLPFITCASCDSAWISYPMPPVHASMGEQLVLMPDGGAIGLFGPVAGASPYEHSTLVQSLMDGLLRVQLRRTGDLVAYAKNLYYGITRSASIPEQYLLLGDPTVALRMPVVQPLLDVETGEIRAGNKEEVSITLQKPTLLESGGILRLFDSESNTELTSKSVSAGQSTWDMVIPDTYDGGCVMALLECQTPNGVRLAGAAFSVLPAPAAGHLLYPVLTKMIGAGYEIIPSESPVEFERSGSATYHFKIKTVGKTSEPLRIVALHNGKKVGEAAHVEATSHSQYASFNIMTGALSESSTSTLSLEVHRKEAPQLDNPLAMAVFDVPGFGTADLKFVPGSGSAYTINGNMVSGATIFLEGEIRNTGNRAAEGFILQALEGNPTTGTELKTINETTRYKVDGLAPGESKRVSFRWENTSTGNHSKIYLVANRNKLAPEKNFDNNILKIPPFTIESIGNFKISSFEISPKYAVPGTSVTVTAILTNDNLLNDHPVTVEIGWKRSFDKKTSFTRMPVTFEDGVATITEVLIAPPGFDHLYVDVNADLNIEESNGSDNTRHSANMIVYELPEFEDSISLTESLTWGATYNFDMPFESQFRVTTDFTSVTDYLLPTRTDVTTGTVSAHNLPSDGAWWVVPWRVQVGQAESPGEIHIRMKVPTLAHDVPGALDGYFLNFQSGLKPVEVRFSDKEEWHIPEELGKVGNVMRLYFGKVSSHDNTIAWQMQKAGNAGFLLNYLHFRPYAAEWDSAPYLLPPSLRNIPLDFKMSIGDSTKWESMFIDWRSGTSDSDGNISWGAWHTTQNQWKVTMEADKYLQLRILGVPVDGETPYLENLRISR